jgi:hypothetical protein
MEENVKNNLLDQLYFHVNRIIDYNWKDEIRNFEEYSGLEERDGKWFDMEEDGKQVENIEDILDTSDHIFADLYFAQQKIDQIKFLEEKEQCNNQQ